MTTDYIDLIHKARVYDVAIKTPLELASGLSARLANQVLLKREDLQSVFSFKLRGAYNKIVHLSAEERAQGVITASAGNHAQGVALAAESLGIRAVIVMPKTTPGIKVESVRKRGAEIVLIGDSYDDAYQHALVLSLQRNLCFVHPYDDPLVIAGQGTIAQELVEQCPAFDAVFVPVGGGGLIAGIGVYLKAMRPNVRIIGVEPDDADSMSRSLAAQRRVMLDQVGLFADGVAVKQVGEETFRIAQEVVDEVILVTTDEICAAIKEIYDDTRSITEPAGALAVAGLKKYVDQYKFRDQTYIAIDSGANINFDRLRYVAERAEVGLHREALFAVTIPEKKGSFLSFCNHIGNRSITEFNYRYSSSDQAHIFVGIELHQNAEDRKNLLGTLVDAGYKTVDLTENEMAKLHIRHMVGGHSPSIENEILYRFEFPERPGALLKFLSNLSGLWNISLFHYRNHGAAFGRVLVGAQVPEQDYKSFQSFLDSLGYAYWEEVDNPAYNLFLK